VVVVAVVVVEGVVIIIMNRGLHTGCYDSQVFRRRKGTHGVAAAAAAGVVVVLVVVVVVVVVVAVMVTHLFGVEEAEDIGEVFGQHTGELHDTTRPFTPKDCVPLLYRLTVEESGEEEPDGS